MIWLSVAVFLNSISIIAVVAFRRKRERLLNDKANRLGERIDEITRGGEEIKREVTTEYEKKEQAVAHSLVTKRD